jgi:regulator of protease activity HflC (stomatin/prohibitin superfamily)
VRMRIALLVLILVVVVLASVLYLVLDTTFIWAFAGSLIGSAVTMLVFFKVVEVEGHEHLIIRRVGRYRDPHAGPGFQGGRFLLFRTIDVPVRIDMRPRTETVENVECYTQDGVGLHISYFLRWRISVPGAFLQNSPGPERVPSTLERIATETLIDEVGQRDFQNVLQGRQSIAKQLTEDLEGSSETVDWGIEVLQVGLGETKPPKNVAEAMARQVAASLLAQARTVEGVGAAQSLDQMQGVLGNPAILDRAVLLQIMHSLSDAIAKR